MDKKDRQAGRGSLKDGHRDHGRYSADVFDRVLAEQGGAQPRYYAIPSDQYDTIACMLRPDLSDTTIL